MNAPTLEANAPIPQWVLRMQPIHMPEGSLDEVATAPTRDELIKLHDNDRVAAWKPQIDSRHHRHFKQGSPLQDYMPINPHEVDRHGAGIFEDTTKRAVSGEELASLREQLKLNPGTHPPIVHQLVATIDALLAQDD